jgi:uncharacterized protein YecT (DUF1311 family)
MAPRFFVFQPLLTPITAALNMDGQHRSCDMKFVFCFLVYFFGLAQLASAEDAPQCDDAQDQSTMTRCAGLDYDKADSELNAAWIDIKAAAVESDQAVGDGSRDNENALLASQRAWITFRDAECEWQGFAARGGSMEPMLVSMCAAKLTRERIKQLQTGVSE